MRGKRLDQFTEQEKAEWFVRFADQNYAIRLKNEKWKKRLNRLPFWLIIGSLVYFLLNFNR